MAPQQGVALLQVLRVVPGWQLLCQKAVVHGFSALPPACTCAAPVEVLPTPTKRPLRNTILVANYLGHKNAMVEGTDGTATAYICSQNKKAKLSLGLFD